MEHIGARSSILRDLHPRTHGTGRIRLEPQDRSPKRRAFDIEGEQMVVEREPPNVKKLGDGGDRPIAHVVAVSLMEFIDLFPLFDHTVDDRE
jgi:hypothetical protein